MAKASELCCWTLEWNNPRTEPPDNQPRVLIEEILPRGQRPEKIYAAHILGGPYGVHFRPANEAPVRRLSEKTKQGIRRKRLERRMALKNPLFAQDAITNALKAKPEYYGTPEI
jgi:hypothetical protein